MKYISLSIMFWLFGTLIAQAQKTIGQNIRGVVTDKHSGLALSGATVNIASLQKTVSTDEAGKFLLENLPLGRYTLTASIVGYENAIFKEVLLSAAKEVYLEIELEEKYTQLTEVVIKPKTNKDKSLNQMALIGSQMFSVEEASRFAGGMDDPARLVANYAGVTTSGTTNNGISIRGNAPSLLQWKLEDVEIPNPNHFADIDVLGGGVLSALSSNVVGNSDFFIGAFPAEYNNAVSGVFDMKLRNGSNQKYQHAFQIGLLGIDFASEGPISRKNRSSYIINYRYSTTGLLTKLPQGEDMGGTLAYQDLNFKFNFPTKKAGTFSLWGLGFIDEVQPTTPTEERKYMDDGILSSANQKSGAVGLSHRYFFRNGNTSIKSTVAATHLGNRIKENYSDLDENKSPRTDFMANNSNLVFTSALSHRFNQRHNNKTGITFTNINYDLNFDHTRLYGQPLENINQTQGNTDLIAAYSQSLYQLSDKVLLTVGLNAQHLTLTNKTSIEPRASIRWQTNKKNSLAFGYGLHSRMEKPDVYFVKDGNGNLLNQNLDFTKSHHLMLSYMYKISEDMNLKVEPYYQSLFHVPIRENGVYSILNRRSFYITEDLVSKGKGRNYGVDVTFSKYLTKGMYYMLTASVFQSEFKAADNKWYDTRYNRNYVVNGLIGKEWMIGHNMFSANVKLTTLGGQRYTPVDEAATLAHPDKEVQYIDDQMFSKQFSPMIIGDFSLSYKLNRKNVAHTFALKSVNASRQKEYIGHKYNIISHAIEPVYSTNAIYNISYRIDF